MKNTRKVLSLILAFVLVLGLLPVTAFATGADSVYISVSYDGQYINDKNGNAIAYIPVSFENLASIDLDEYGLSDYKYDLGGNGAGKSTTLKVISGLHSLCCPSSSWYWHWSSSPVLLSAAKRDSWWVR